VVGPRDLEPDLPSRLPTVPRRPPRSVSSRSTGMKCRSARAPRACSEVPVADATGPLTAAERARSRAASAPGVPRLATLPRVGKELPSLPRPPPEPSMLAARPHAAQDRRSRRAAVGAGGPRCARRVDAGIRARHRPGLGFSVRVVSSRVQRKITEMGAAGPVATGRALVVFEISRNGEVKRTALEGSSATPSTIRPPCARSPTATPFPPLPEQYKRLDHEDPPRVQPALRSG